MYSYGRSLTRAIGFLLICFLINQCQDEFQRLVLLSTDNVTDITAVSARVSGTILDEGEGIKQYGHCWSTEDQPDINGFKTDLGSRKDTGVFTSTLEALDPSAKYYVRAFASDGARVFYGETKSFTTQDFTIPVVQTGTVYDLTPASASVSGNLLDLGNGIDIVSQHGHCWSLSPSPTTAHDKTELGSTTSTGEYISSLSGLEDSTRYYVRAYATNEKGTAYGSVISFITPGYLPVIFGDTLEILSQTSVRIISNLVYLGPDNIVTHHGHCWASHDHPGITDNTTDLGSTTSTGSFFSTLSDLTPGELYYATSYATNSYGTAYGAVIPFVSGDPALHFINDPNLVAYFPFNGTAEDLSPVGIDGTINGAVFTADRNEVSGSALSFDGNDDWVDCGASNRGITNTITISLWVLTSDTYSFIITKYNLQQKQAGYVIAINIYGEIKLEGRDKDDGTDADFIITSDPSYPSNDSNWHHVLGIVDQNNWKLYIDGVLEGTDYSPTANPKLTNSIPLFIASNPAISISPVTEFSGKIDDVLIFNRALTPEEITILSGSKR